MTKVLDWLEIIKKGGSASGIILGFALAFGYVYDVVTPDGPQQILFPEGVTPAQVQAELKVLRAEVMALQEQSRAADESIRDDVDELDDNIDRLSEAVTALATAVAVARARDED